MKWILITIFSFSMYISNAQYPVLELGAEMPEADKMKCVVSNNEVYFDELAEENGILVIFSCNTCPFVVAWENRYPIINELATDNNIGFALVNSNFLKRNDEDSPEAMKEHAKKHQYRWPYLIDKESMLANKFGAQTTPHVFLFDKNMKLVYKGAIDDNYKDASKVEQFYLKDAINSLAKNEEIAVKETRNLGCSIKRKTD
ncbi:MAG: redoxin family protein [Prolixibacteraceae bacterium]|nr:redoxin family protein [Prolixibacteraceae bacterium]MBN2650132.1 redoxin family protein [Prolixibacteraceae bacterium]